MKENDLHSTSYVNSMGRAASIAVLIMVVSNILSRLLGFGRMIVLAKVVGAEGLMDAYSFSFLLPDLLNHILAGSALSITFIPFFQDIFTNKSEDDAWKFFSNVFTVGTILFIITITFSLLYTKTIIDIFAGDNITKDPLQFALTVKLTRIIIPAQLFFFWGALLNGVQYAKKQFVLPALTPLFYNIGIISGGLLLFPYIGVDGFSWGVLGGAFVGNVVIQVPGALGVGMKFKPRVHLRDKNLIKWFIITIPFILGLAITFSNEFLFRIFGSSLKGGAGAIANLDYSYKAMMFLVGLFGQAFAAGIYPFISQLAVEKKYNEMNSFILSIVTKIASVAIPVSLIMMLFTENIIALLYQRGKFTASDTVRTAKVLLYYLPATFFMSASLIVVRAYYSMKNTVLPLVISTTSVIICIPLYFYFGRRLGAGGIALTTTISLCVTFFSLIFVWKVVYKIDHLFRFFRSLILIGIIALIGYCLCGYLKSITTPFFFSISSIFIKNLLIVISNTIPSLVIVAILLQVTGVCNVKSMIERIVKRFLPEKNR